MEWWIFIPALLLMSFLLERKINKLEDRVEKVEHGLRTHGHGIVYLDGQGNKVKRTDPEGNSVTLDE